MTVGNEEEGPAESGAGYVFGPVFSRRLGQSLGIDPVPSKTCNWNCVYCQLGRTVPLRSKREEFFPSSAIVREVESVLAQHPPDTIDWVTFVGSGETLLHSGMGWMVRRLKEMTDLPIAVITNGSLLSDPGVRKELLPADAVLPSLDAGSPPLFKRINRPHPGIPFREHVAGLEAFSREYSGRLLLEIMLIRGLNDTEEALSDLAEIIRRIEPTGIHLSRPDRPPAEPWVSPSDEDGFMRAVSALGSVAQVLHPAESVLRLEDPDRAVETILAVLGRHPMSEVQLDRALAPLSPDAAARILDSLEDSGRIKQTTRQGERFWVSANAEFPSPEGDHS